MWCSACQQDVVAKSLPESEETLCCGKCGQLLKPPAQGGATPQEGSAIQTADSTTASRAADPQEVVVEAMATSAENAALERHLVDQLSPHADWELELQMAGVRQLITWLEQQTPAELLASKGGATTAIEARNTPCKGLPPQAPWAAQSHREAGPDAGSPADWLAWSALALGTGLLACGSVLLLWSVFASRDDLWSVGLALAALGQGGLLVGLIGQLGATSAAKIV